MFNFKCKILKNLILTFVIFFSLFSYSQSRVNPKKDLMIGEFKLWALGDDISGWDLDKGEEWKERKGYLRVGKSVDFIDINEKYQLKGYITESKSRTPQNFNEIGVISVNYKDKKYIGLALEKVEGTYRYPSIKEDYYTFESHYVYLFEEDELRKLENLNGELELKVFLGTYGDRFLSEKKYQSCYENLKFLFEAGRNLEDEIFKLKRTESEGEEVVRFLTPQTISRYGKLIDFDNHYFEVSLDKFNELISLLFE